MIISNLLLSQKNKIITLSADVAFKGSKPERMYFSTDLKNSKYIYADYSPFLAAVLLPCMKTGENIEIDGFVSPILLKNTEKIMKLIVRWNIGLKKINIKAQTNSRKITYTKPKKVGVFFSAGVDSFYTYLKNKNKVTDLIFIHGFDIPLNNKLLFKKINNINTRIAKAERLNLITVSTNVADIVEKHLIWDFAHGGALAAVALFLRNELKTIFISGAVKKDKLFPYGTHPELDKLWSSEYQNIIHDGTEYARLEKVMKKVSKSPLALNYLHVCTQNIKGKYNCSKCYKCLITMIELECAGVLGKQNIFNKKLDLKAVKDMYYDYQLLYNIQGEANLSELKRKNINPELQEAIGISLEKSKKPSPMKKITKLIAQFDQRFNNRRIYRMIFSINKNQDRNILFKFLLQRGVFK
jgi:hypothetical protein